MPKLQSTEIAQTLRRRSATLIGAVLIGLAGLSFATAADWVQSLFGDLPPGYDVLPVVIAPLGFAALAFLTLRFAPAARGSGIPQVIAAAPLPEPETSPLISLKTAAAKALLTLGGLLVGASAGREGPTVQISAAIMVAVHRIFGVRLSPAVVIAGGAAGVSAAFNTPLAGVAFALEELAAAYEQRLALLVMAAVLISGLVSLSIAGDYLYFGALHQTMPLAAGLMAVPVVAVVGAVAGTAFARVLLLAGSARLLAPLRRHPVLTAAACGLVVGLAAWLSGGLTWGTGYTPAKVLVEGGAEPWWFAPAKFAAAAATALSGIPGGIFAPSLSVGAGLGGVLAPFFPACPPGAIALIGMTAYFVGVVRAPLTAVIIIMEMTDSHGLLAALLATAIIAEGVSALLSRERLYVGLARPFRAAPPPQPSPGD